MKLTSDERALQAKEVSWEDTDKGVGRWQLYTICRGCGEMGNVRGKERDRVLCRDCFFGDVRPMALFDVGICGFSNRDESVAYFTEGRIRRAEELRRSRADRLRLLSAEKAEVTRKRNVEIARLVDEEGYSYEQIAEDFGVTVATAKTLAKRGRTDRGVALQSVLVSASYEGQNHA